MKNFNFSIVLTLYIFIVGWVFTRTKDLEILVVFALAASPVILLAFYFQGRRIGFCEELVETQALLSHLLTLACSVLLFLMVLKMRTGTRFGPMQMFGNFRVGWNYEVAVQLLALDIVMVASAVTMWTSYRFQNVRAGFFGQKAPRLFFAGTREVSRLLIYIYLFLFCWALGAGAVALFWKEYDLHLLMIVTSRAMVPLMGLAVVAILKLRVMGVAVPVALLAVAYLMAYNVSEPVALVFVGVPLAAAAVFFGARSIAIGSPAPAAEPEASSEEEVSDEEVH